MLRNAGFEADWSEEQSHDCLLCVPGSAPERVERGNIFVPPGWLVWFNHSETLAQPEVNDAWLEHDPRRVHSGEKGIHLFTFGRKHDAGFLQQVSVPIGSTVLFGAWAQAWSNHKDRYLPDDFPHPDDPKWSEGAGYEHLMLLDREVPELNGDPQNDAVGNICFHLGIDPTGGTDPNASSVTWGTGGYSYNNFAPVPTVEAVAQSDTVTVFLRSTTLWPFKHNDVYWDDAELQVVSGDDPEPPPEPEPPEEGRGDPRVQYKRTYVLLSPLASSALAQAAVTDGAWDEMRFTIGSSADDAGIGNLDDRRVVAINPSEWGSGEDGRGLLGFFEEHYPGVAYIPIEATTENVGRKLKEVWGHPFGPNWEQYLLWQCNPLWGSRRFGATSCTLTICQSGCYLTLLAAAQRIYGIDKDATPLTANAALGPEGYTGCYLLWSAAKAKLGISIRSGNTAEAEAHMANGGVCLIRVMPKDPMHFVLCVAIEDGEYMILDPFLNYYGTLSKHYAGVHSWRILKPVDAPVPPPPLPIDLPHIYSVHEDCSHEAACLMRDNGIKGYIVWTEGLGFNPSDYSGRDYRIDTNNFGHTPIARLNNGYGSSGTIPLPEHYDRFAQRVANFVAASRGCNIWIIGNEQNNDREWAHGEVVTPELYAHCFNKCRAAIKGVQPDAIVMPGAVDGYNAQLMDSREYMRRLWRAIDGAEGVCVHAYTHGPDPALITSNVEFSHAPLLGVNYNFKNFIDMLRELPAWAQELPVYITETNTWAQTNEPSPPEDRLGWLDVNDGWIQMAYGFVNGWNSAGGNQQIRCLTVYRWPAIDPWVIHGKSNVIADFVAAMQRKYKPYL